MYGKKKVIALSLNHSASYSYINLYSTISSWASHITLISDEYY